MKVSRGRSWGVVGLGQRFWGCEERGIWVTTFWRQGTSIYTLWGPYSNIYSNIRLLYLVLHFHIRILLCIFEYYSNIIVHILILFEYWHAYSNTIRIWQCIFEYYLYMTIHIPIFMLSLSLFCLFYLQLILLSFSL
jgi:hypothetical protein